MGENFSSLVIEPGNQKWEARVGGDFHEAESEAGQPYRWLGSQPGWIYLPDLPATSPHPQWTVEIQGLIHYWGNTPLIRLTLSQVGTATQVHHDLPLKILPAQIPVAAGIMQVSLITGPVLTLEFGQGFRIPVSFAQIPDMQVHTISVPFINLRTTRALRLEPNFGFPPSRLGASDQRVLSFRVHRIIISPGVA
jgi:hypothetical protein